MASAKRNRYCNAFCFSCWIIGGIAWLTIGSVIIHERMKLEETRCFIELYEDCMWVATTELCVENNDTLIELKQENSKCDTKNENKPNHTYTCYVNPDDDCASGEFLFIDGVGGATVHIVLGSLLCVWCSIWGYRTRKEWDEPNLIWACLSTEASDDPPP